ncbi:MAG: DivIVA domain-containing protein [Nocardioides sp.]
MPLTPEDVSNKRFTPVRLREGYDMGEVDQFLDEVEAELERLHKENDDLRAKLSSAQSGAAPVAAESEAEPVAGSEAEAAGEPEAEPEVAPLAATDQGTLAGVETIRVETITDASNAAARLLEMATRNADQLVDEAKAEADKILGEARTTAERSDSESKDNADRLEADARGRAQMLDTETADKRTQMFGELETERDRLAAEVDNLRSFEREYRSRLKTYFSQQLEALSSAEGDAGSDPAPQPKRLRSVLGDDEG